MEITQSTMSAKNQIVIPAQIRQALGLKAGDALNWQIVHPKGSKTPKVIAEATPTSWSEYTHGLGQEIWQTTDIDTYIDQLRSEWQTQA